MKPVKPLLWFIPALLCAAPIWAQGGASAKDIFLDNGSPAKPSTRVAVKYNVLLERDGETRNVPAGYRFLDGDHLKLQVTSNHDGYVYVLHRTVSGNPESLARYVGSKGIVEESDSPYKLLYPRGAGATNNRVRAKQITTVPGAARSFGLDDHPGIEKLVVVVSAKPINISKYFNVDNGELRGGGSRDDSTRSILDQLNKDLEEMSTNALKTESKDIREVDDYAAPSNGDKPMVIAVDLKHYQNR